MKKAIDIFEDENFIECLKYNTYDDKDNRIKVFDKNNEIIKKNIDKITKIDCLGYWIVNIKGISIFKNLKTLNLFANKVKNLPKEISELINLEILNLIANKIKKLPDNIGKLTNLKELHLYWNQIQTLPEEIWKLKNLEILNLSINQLQSLSNEIWRLCKLKKLYLSNNKLQRLPIEILKLGKLKSVWLNNAFNLSNLEQAPNELFYILKQLEKKKVLEDDDLEYLEEKVYPILKEKIKEKYRITNLKQIKDNFNLDNFSF